MHHSSECIPDILELLDTNYNIECLAMMLAYNDELPHCHSNDTIFNCSRTDYLVFSRGPQMLAMSIVLPVTILYVATFLAGIIGNVIVCLVIVQHPGMHTATNYYLFNLAVSDVIYLVFGLPFDLSLFWHQYPYPMGIEFCKLRAWISETSTYVSVLTIVAFTMERYVAICHPMYRHALSGLQRAIRLIGILWIISLISAAPFGYYSEISYINYPPDQSIIWESGFCAMLNNPNGFPLWELSSLIFFAIPMIIIILMYTRIGIQIRSVSNSAVDLGVRRSSSRNKPTHLQSRKNVIRMLAVVVITFFISWAPFHAQRIMYLHASDWEHFEVLNTWLFSVAGLFYYFSCFLNPILYNIMSKRYRSAFREIIFGKPKTNYTSVGMSNTQTNYRDPLTSQN